MPLFVLQSHAPDRSPEQAPGLRKKLKAKSAPCKKCAVEGGKRLVDIKGTQRHSAGPRK